MDLISPDKDNHLHGISDLFSRSFGEYWTWMDFSADGYMEGAPYDWSASRVGIVDGEVVTHFGVWDFTMRIGSGLARTACIGAVATDRRQRKLGLMGKTAAGSINSFRESGYDLSLLFGIANYYDRFGYVAAFSEQVIGVHTRDLKPLQPAVRFELFDGDFTTFAGQYNSENEGVTGTFVRPTYTTNRRPAQFSGYTFDGGYLVGGRVKGELQVADCAGPPEMVLDVARQLAIHEVAPEISFRLTPGRSRTGEYLRTIAHTRTESFVPNGGPMIKVVNLHSTLQKISAELSGRMEASGLGDYTGRLVIDGDNERVALVIESGSVVQVEPASATETGTGTISAGPSVARLIIGDGDPNRICRQSDISLDADARFLIPALFPDQEPSTILWDRF